MNQQRTFQHAFLDGMDGMDGMREAAGQLPPPVVDIRDTYSAEVAVGVR
ncbi:hypothetical protein ACFVYG_06375 [Streptomyces sp. NPDC058256]